MTGAQASDPVGRDLLFTFAQRVAELERLARAGVAIAGVVVYATGSEDVLDGLGADVRAFEYRHVPDPGYLERTLIPPIDRVRAAKWRGSPPQEAR